MIKLLAGALMSAALLTGGSAGASTVTFESGTVAGSVSNVDVLGTEYDVSFVGATSSADLLAAGFTFSTQSDASAAATALAAALNAGGATAAYVTTPGLPFDAIFVATFYDDDGTDLLGEAAYYTGGSWITLPSTYVILTTSFPYTAIWTATGPSSTVPLPAGGLLIASALGALAVARRRKTTA